jgi:uridylate kinase
MKYKRILLKLSGESLMGNDAYGINSEIINDYAQQISNVLNLGVEVAIVIGGGNIFRGLSGVGKGFDRVKGDQMGMLATVINSLALQSALENMGANSKVMTAVRMEPVGELYGTDKALEYMKQKTAVIIAGGTGNPFFTTDSASALRGVELKCEVLLKGTRVDGVYTADPEKDKMATKYTQLSFDEAYERKLKIMDLTAFTMCRENNLPIIVFDMNTVGNLEKEVLGNGCGTLIHV